MLKEIKGQVDNVQRFLQAHIDNLEGVKNAEPQQNIDKGYHAVFCFVFINIFQLASVYTVP